MKILSLAWLATAFIFLVMDACWLSLMASRLYAPALGDLMAPAFRPAPAALFYLIYISGIVHFAIRPALAAGQWPPALVNGALLGLLCYATYDLTSQAVLRHWSSWVTVADMTWGTVATGTAAALATRLMLALR